MAYRVLWRLVGPAERLLDSGDVDEFGDETSASEAVDSLLSNFAEAGRNADRGYWWGRKAPDSDLEIRLFVA